MMNRKSLVISLVAVAGITLAMVLPDTEEFLSSNPFFLLLSSSSWLAAYSLDASITYKNRHLILLYEANLLLYKLSRIRHLPLVGAFLGVLVLESALIMGIPYLFLRTFDLDRSGFVTLIFAFLHISAFFNNRKFADQHQVDEL